MAMNKIIFEQKWKVIRVQSTARWSLMADFDLNKVDKAEDQYHRFVALLQVKYRYTRQQARVEVNKFWLEYEANTTNNVQAENLCRMKTVSERHVPLP